MESGFPFGAGRKLVFKRDAKAIEVIEHTRAMRILLASPSKSYSDDCQKPNQEAGWAEGAPLLALSFGSFVFKIH